MSDKQTKAILVVSFGTSFPDTRKRTITAIEEDIAAAYRITEFTAHGPVK